MKKTLNEYDVAKGMISQIKEMAKPVLKKKKMILTEEKKDEDAIAITNDPNLDKMYCVIKLQVLSKQYMVALSLVPKILKIQNLIHLCSFLKQVI